MKNLRKKVINYPLKIMLFMRRCLLSLASKVGFKNEDSRAFVHSAFLSRLPSQIPHTFHVPCFSSFFPDIIPSIRTIQISTQFIGFTIFLLAAIDDTLSRDIAQRSQVASVLIPIDYVPAMLQQRRRQVAPISRRQNT